MRHTMARLASTAAIAALGLAGSGALTTTLQARQSGDGIPEQEPDEVETVQPCCASRDDRDFRYPPGLVEIARPKEPFDDATWQRLKEEARRDATMPRGRDLRDVEPGAGALLRAPGLVSSFEGLQQGEVGPTAFPPDTQVAVGPGHVLQAVNVAVRLSDRDGSNAAAQTLNEHFGLGPSGLNGVGSVFDPKTHYDPMSGRFFLAILEVDGVGAAFARSYLSVSRSARPQSLGDDDWCRYVFSTKKGNTWGDYPGLGMNEKWLAISTNNFPFSGPFSLQSRLFVMDKTTLVDNATSCPATKVFKFNLHKNDFQEFTVQPAQHYEATGLDDSPLFAVSSNYLGGSSYTVFRIKTKSGRAKPKLSREEITASDPYAIPPEATQSGGEQTLETGGPQVMQQAVYRHGRLWFAHATGCEIKGSDVNLSCVRVLRYAPENKGGTVDFEDTFGVKREYFFWPGIAVTTGGDVVAAFQRSGDNQLLGVAYAGLKQGAARFGEVAMLPKGFDKRRSAIDGTCTLQTARGFALPTGEIVVRVRTGDYVGVVPDPSTEEVWMAGEYGKLLFGTSCAWGTRIVRVAY